MYVTSAVPILGIDVTSPYLGDVCVCDELLVLLLLLF